MNSSLLSGGGSFSTTNVTAIAQLVTTSPVAAVAADLMHPPADAGEIVSEVSASGDPTTNFLTISAVDRSPARAAEIANAFAHAISQNLQSGARREINRAIAGVSAGLSRMSRNNPTRPNLVSQLNQLRAARATQGSAAAILQPAAAGSPVGLNTRRAVEIGLVIGLLLAFGAVLLAASADGRLRTPGDLEAMAEVPLLAAIAPSAFSEKLDTGRADEEAFQMLRTGLTVFNPEQRLGSVLITSAGEKDGKTTVAVRLALVTARAGLRVLLIDADLRRAQVGARLGIQAEAGLGAVLAGERPLDEVLVDLLVDGPASGQLTVLPAGPTPSNPAALIGSNEMRRVLAEAESRWDLVIVDTPAALAVSDPLPLMRVASGVVLVVRMNRSSRTIVRRMQWVIQAAGGTSLGVVATGVTSRLDYYYSGKYYATRASANGAKGRPGKGHQPVGGPSGRRGNEPD